MRGQITDKGTGGANAKSINDNFLLSKEFHLLSNSNMIMLLHHPGWVPHQSFIYYASVKP